MGGPRQHAGRTRLSPMMAEAEFYQPDLWLRVRPRAGGVSAGSHLLCSEGNRWIQGWLRV